MNMGEANDGKPVSENVSNAPGGRPRLFDDEMAIYEALDLFADVKTERQRQNIIYRQRAIHVRRRSCGFEEGG